MILWYSVYELSRQVAVSRQALCAETQLSFFESYQCVHGFACVPAAKQISIKQLHILVIKPHRQKQIYVQ